MITTDETNITEIELLPDGRICVFGMSLEVLEVLDELQGATDGAIRHRLPASEDSPSRTHVHIASGKGCNHA